MWRSLVVCELPTSDTWGSLLNFQEQHSPHYSEPVLTPSSFLQILLVALLKMLLFGPFGCSSSLNFLSIVAFTIYSIAHGAPLFDNSTIPTNLTVSCSNALLSDVNCSPSVMGLQYGNYYPETTLQRVCTSDCDAALAKYEADVTTACAGQSWNGYDDYLMPLAIIPDTIRYQYNLTCLMDSGRYCNIVAAQAAAALDPDGKDPVTGGKANVTTPPSPCDLCFVESLRFQAGSPYYDGPLLASVYSSKTSSCKVSGMPLITTTIPTFPTTTQVSTPTPTCVGKTYAISSGDTCYSISKSQQIGTGWLLTDNNLNAYCADFPTSGTLCLINTCKTTTVKQNDTCTAIAQANNVTVPQLKAWNLVINAGCNNINNLNGSEICINAPGTPYNAPTGSTTLAPITPTTVAPAPTDVADGTNPKCGQYYHVEQGDYCNLIVIKFGISLDDFIFLNPAINSNCTNLFAEESYCVAPVGDINTYSGRPGYTSAAVTAITGTQVYSALPTATYVPAPFNNSRNLAEGTRSDCVSYFDGDNYQSLQALNITTYNSVCDFVADLYLVTAVDLAFWNPSLGNSSLPNCTFQAGLSYCARWSGDTRPDQQVPIVELPLRNGTAPNCTQYYDAVAPDTCQTILDENQLTIAQFFAYNPAVGSDCANLWLDYRYCVRTPDYIPPTSASTTVSAPTTTAPPGAPGPTLSGIPSNCNNYYMLKSGDSCSSVEDQFFITDAQFHAWNPAISADCSENFWLNYYYCVGTTDNTVTRSTPTFPATTTSAVPLPSPIQDNNVVSNCNKFAQTQDGDYCSLFAQRNSITTTQLYTWNQVLGTDGSGCDTQFWLGYYYCIGVSS